MSKLQMENNMPCIICNKLSSKFVVPLSRQKQNYNATTTRVTHKRFFSLLERYLANDDNCDGSDAGDIEGIHFISDKKVLDNSMICCEDCVKIIQSFCQLYNQLEYIKLQLDWKVKTLSNLMSAAQKDNHDQSQIDRAWGITNLQKTETVSLVKMIELVNAFRSNLIKKCTRKLEGSFPRLTLRKCKPIAEVTKLNQIYTNDVIPCQVKSEPGLFSPSPKAENITSRVSCVDVETFSNNLKEDDSCNANFDELFDNHAFSNEDSHDSHHHGREISTINLSEAKQINTTENEPQVQPSLYIKTESTECSDDEDYEHDDLNESAENSESEEDEEKSASPTPTSKTGGLKPYRCDGCPLRFSRKHHLTRHRESSNCSANQDEQSIKRRHPCKICHKLFTRVEHLKRHLKNIHSKKSVEVKGTIAHLSQSIEPVAKEDPKANYPCIVTASEDCGKPQSSLDPESGRVRCGLCFKTFKTPRQFYTHFDELHRKTRFKCSLCEKEFTRRDKYNHHHEGVHLNMRSFSCPTCSKRFKFRSELSKHVRRGTCKKKSDGPHLCSICGKVFAKWYQLEAHVKIVHQKLERVSCDQCGKVYSTPSKLRVHVKQVHLKLREYICEQCGKAFSQAFRLKEHVKSNHSEVRDVGCELCGKMFKLKSALMVHHRAKHADRKGK